ncbi:hypothetical protein BX666DRAFT_2023084 [Dichotomocladium elegans]|nr:hypothetical protein BX666DRAFT_2023084 [Dichotomocladium elegans]
MAALQKKTGVLSTEELSLFKFRSFNQRIETIKIDAVRRSRLVEENPDESDSFFYQSLISWRDLNLTRHFKDFYQEMAPLCKTLPSIIYNKEKIIDVLEKHLQVRDSMATDAILDLITKLAKDLEGDFYPHFMQILKSMLPLVRRRDVAVIESLFNAMAYLFKYLSRQLLNDLCPTYTALCHLLGNDEHVRPHIQHFTAEGFAFLMRKARKEALSELVKHILTSLSQNGTDQYIEGVAMVFFECIKQVGNQLHSRAVIVYKELVRQVLAQDIAADELESYPLLILLQKTTLLCIHHTDREHLMPLVEVLLDELDKVLDASELNVKELTMIMSTINVVVTVRKGKRVKDFVPIVQRIQRVAQLLFTKSAKSHPKYLLSETLGVITSVLTLGSLESVLSGIRVVLEALTSFDNVPMIYGFFLGLSRLGWNDFAQATMPYIAKYTSLNFAKYPYETILLLARLASSDAFHLPEGVLSSCISPEGLLRFPSSSVPDGLLDLLKKNYDWDKERDTLNDFDLTSDKMEDIPAITVLNAAISIIPCVQLNNETAVEIILSLIDSISNHISLQRDENTVINSPFVTAHKNFVLENLIGTAVETISKIVSANDLVDKTLHLHEKFTGQILKNHCKNEVVLRGVFSYLDLLRSSSKYNNLFAIDHLAPTYHMLKENLSSYYPTCRLYSIKIIAIYDQPLMKPDALHPDDEVCEIAQIAIDLEESEMTLQNYRDKIMYTQKLGVVTSSGRLPDVYADFALRMCLGLLNIHLRPMWEEVEKVLAICAEADGEQYWKLCFNEISKFEDEKQLVYDGFSKTAFTKFSETPEIQNGQATRTGKISFECPNLNKYRSIEAHAVAEMLDRQSIEFALLFIKISGQEDALMDYWNYYRLLLHTFKRTPAIIEQRARHLVPMFFHFLQNEYKSALDEGEDIEEENGKDAEASEDMEESSMDIDSADDLEVLPRTKQATKTKILAWLELFASFVNPRTLFRSQEIHTIFMRLIAKSDPKLQKAALECLFTWKDRGVTQYADNLRNLLDDTQFRDELLMLIGNGEQTIIDPSHRDKLMPIMMRVLYGRYVQRTAKPSRRMAILEAITLCKDNEIQLFLDLALNGYRPILQLSDEIKDENGGILEFTISDEGDSILKPMPWGRHHSFLELLKGMIFAMGAKSISFMAPFMKILLYIAKFTQRTSDTRSAKARAVNNEALLRLIELFKLHGQLNFNPYLDPIFGAFVTPRVAALLNESALNKAPILNLFMAWADRSARLPLFTEHDENILPQLFKLLGAKKILEHNLSTVLSIVETILNHCDEDLDGKLRERFVIPFVDILLGSLHFRLTQSKDDTTFGTSKYTLREISIVSRIASFTRNGDQAAVIVDLLLPNLRKPSRQIPEKTKELILTIWSKFMPIVPGFELNSTLYFQYYSTAAIMFSSLKSRECRVALTDVFRVFTDMNPELTKVGELIVDLNSYSPKRLDEPDYDRMLDALNTIADDLCSTLNHHQWQPLLHQIIYNMHNEEEMAVRGAAAHCMNMFLKSVKKKEGDNEEYNKLLNYVNHVVFPAIKTGLLVRVELVRMEFVNVLNTAVKTFPALPSFSDLTPLLFNGDEEANFFNNVYHMQIHRRDRALTRLADIASTGAFSGATINSILIPIVTAFFYETDRTSEHNLISRAVATITALAAQLKWGHYYKLFKTYMDLIIKKEDMEKLYVRIITGILEAFHFDIRDVEVSDEMATKVMGRQKIRIEYLSSEQLKIQAEAAISKEESSKDAATEVKRDDEEGNETETAENKSEKVDEDADADLDEDEEDADQKMAEASANASKALAEKIHGMVITRMLPLLNTYLTKAKSRKSVIIRMPMAFGIAKLLRQLPERTMRLNLPGLLISLCQMIRSRAQDVRDAIRDTLIKINTFLGPSYFSFIVKELRTALTKGYELHVLGFTVNALLIKTIPNIQVGELDYCLEDIVNVLINDVFGATGQEKDADGMTGKTMEAKTQKSISTFEQLARVIHFKNVNVMLLPLRDVMSETQSLKILRKVDDILRRISVGLGQNPEFGSFELLDFCLALVTENLDNFKIKTKAEIKKSQLEKNYEVQIKRPGNEPQDHYKTNAHRFVGFGLSLFQTALKREKFDPRDPEQQAKLDPFVPVVANTLYSTHVSNVILGCKVMRTLMQYPMLQVRRFTPDIIKRTFQLIRQAGNTKSDLVQNCFKMLTMCIRDLPNVKLNENQLVYLITIIQPDIEEPERQSTVFALIRAILSRKFMAAEVYDLLDRVAQVMVTNQAPEIRDQARSAYFTFLMEYPQGLDRLKTQMSFMVKNLEYVYEQGRISVMELLHQVISKFGDEALMTYAESIFLGLVLRLVNDDSAKCREMSAELIRQLVGRCDDDKLAVFYRLLDSWIERSDKQNLQRASCQVYGLVIDTLGSSSRSLAIKLVPHLTTILEENRDQGLVNEGEEDEPMDVDMPWEVVYYALNTMARIGKLFPELMYTDDSTDMWEAVSDMLLHPHAWIRTATGRLFGLYFANIEPQGRTYRDKRLLFLTREKLRDLVLKFIEQLKSQYLTEEMSNQIVRNLFFISKCFYVMTPEEDPGDAAESKEPTDSTTNAIQAKLDQFVSRNSHFWMMRRLTFTARGGLMQKGYLMRASIFKWYAAVANQMQPEELPPYLTSMITPLYKVTTDQIIKDAKFDELKQLANEVLELLQNKAGPTIYFSAYQRVRQREADTREERKAKRAIEAVANPEIRAKKKLRKAEKKKQKKPTFA